jgi:uncharacterized protein (UPF0332 family)
MIKTSENRLQKAEEYLREAEFIYGEGIGNMHVLANLYHSMMNSLFALFEVENIGNLTHADIVERFDREYIQTGKFEARFAEAIHFAYHITHQCDCDKMKPPENKEIERLFPVVRDLLQTVKRYKN